jgi:hypothetical protein
MHASEAFLNGAGEKTPRSNGMDEDGLALLNTLLVASGGVPESASGDTHKPASLDQRKPKDQRQAEEESDAETVSKPGGFDNDPDDPRNPNEVRERHLNKIKP